MVQVYLWLGQYPVQKKESRGSAEERIRRSDSRHALYPRPLAALDAWIERQSEPPPSRPEAIRRLVERALVAEPSAPRARSNGAPKAAEMASHEINKLGDKSATDEERTTRKRRLIQARRVRGIRRK